MRPIGMDLLENSVSDKEKDFCNICVDEFKRNPCNAAYRLFPPWGEYALDCPQVLVFDPSKQDDVALFCPAHQQQLKSTKEFTSNRCKRYGPRSLYCYGRNTFLVSRVYKCALCKAEYLAHDQVLTRQLPNEVAVPFCLSRRSGYHLETFNMIKHSIANGVTFAGIEDLFRIGAQTTYNLFHEQGPGRRPGKEKAFLFPGRRKIRDDFVSHMEYVMKDFYKCHLDSYHPQSLSLDATFKIMYVDLAIIN